MFQLSRRDERLADTLDGGLNATAAIISSFCDEAVAARETRLACAGVYCLNAVTNMKIARKDFFPQVLGGVLIFKQWESIEAVTARANEWIAAQAVRVINVETVLLPADVKDEDPQSSTILVSGSVPTSWKQVVRVWYELIEPLPS